MAPRAQLAILFFMAVFVAASLLSARQAFAAESVPDDAVTIVVADGAGLRDTGTGVEMARSLVALMAALEPDRLVAFIDSERPTHVFGPVHPGTSEFRDMLAGISAELASGSTTGEGIFGALAEASTLMGLERAGVGSRVLVILGGRGDEDFASLLPRITPVVSRMADQGFGLDVVTTSDRDADVALFADRLAQVSTGRVIEANSPRALTDVARALLPGAGSGMDVLGEARMSDGEVLSLPVDVVPGAVDLRVMLFKDDAHGSVRLLDPEGLEAGRTDSTLVDSPFVLAWNVADPVPGTWRLEANGINGPVTVWGGQSNGVALTLETQGPLPSGQAVELVAHVSDTADIAEGAQMYAHVTSPSGVTLTYLLNDDGKSPDAVAGDRYFSASAAPLTEHGDYDVVLELAWLETSYRVTSQYSIRSQPFPSLEVVSALDGDLAANERTLVATASVNVDGQPYPVAPSAITWEFSGTTHESQVVELVPRSISSAGEGWTFDVYATVSEPGNSAMTLRLDVEYVGQPYVYTAGSIVISVPAPLVTAAPEQTKIEAATPEPVEETSSFPWWVLTFPALVALGLTGAGARWLMAAAPAGYLYNDRQERLVDFSTLNRGPLARLLSRDKIAGSDLGVPGLDGVTFLFERGRVAIRSAQPSTTVRVDSKPLFGEATLGLNNWIGTGGRAYSFLLKPPVSVRPPAAG
jgi:hypothetical protein